MRVTRSVVLLLIAIAASAENWPRFRGPTGQGHSKETGVPTRWSATENVQWSTPIPGLGWSSPIVWDNRVFVTTATDSGTVCRVLSLDAATGKVLWDREVARQSTPKLRPKNSYATPTPVTDGRHIYAVFGDGTIVALDYEGKTAWINRDVRYYSEHGLGASPILHGELLIMPFDASSTGEDRKVGWQKPWDQSFIAALDRNTGKLKWKASRGMSRIGHVTPQVVTVDGKPQLISAAGDVIQGFDLANGERIWNVYSQGEGVVPSVVVGEGLVFTASGFEKSTIRAVRLGGARGDVTKTHIAWEQTKGVPHIPSFVYAKPYLFTITESGIAMCLRAATGEVLWQERIGGEHAASPIYAEGKVYFLSESGETTIIRAGPAYEVLARNSIGERCQASHAVSGGRLFIRGDTKLYAIGR